MKRTFWPSSVINIPLLVVLLVFISGGTVDFEEPTI